MSEQLMSTIQQINGFGGIASVEDEMAVAVSAILSQVACTEAREDCSCRIG